MSLTSPLAEALRDRYVLERELGRGGMATVYLVHDLKHDRRVALKVLHSEVAAILGRERFQREIRVAARLQHPHILSVHDSGEAVGQLWFTMPYIEGESLRECLRRECQLSLDGALRITREAAAALQHAHEHGVIHRDIKPENLLLTTDGSTLVADFGIARPLSGADEDLTQPGMSIGTPAYMSPEQAVGDRNLDARTDIYSLACVLFEMLAGEPPYTGPNPQSIIAKRLADPVPSIRRLRTDVSTGLDSAIQRGLARNPAGRFATVKDFIEALAASSAPGAKESPGIVRAWPRRVVAALTALAVVGVIAVVAFETRSGPTPIVVHRQLTFSGTADWPAISKDGRWLAYRSRDPAGPTRLVVQDLASAVAPVTVASTIGSMREPKWSRDGSKLFYAASDSASEGTYVVPRLGGAQRKVSGYLSGYDITAGGDAIYGSREDSVFVMEPGNGQRKTAFSMAPTADWVYSLALSPNGRWLAFAGVKGGTTFLGLSGMDGSKVRRLVEGVPRWMSIAWTPTSDGIYYLRDLGNGANVAAGGDLMKIEIDPISGSRKGSPTLVLGGAFVQSFTVSSDAKSLLYSKAPPQQRIWAVTLRGPPASTTVAKELTSGTSVYGTPDISPDGKWVAYARNDAGTGNIYVTPFDSYTPKAITTSAADEWSPRWSPDGARIAFTARDTESPGILVLDLASGEVRRISSEVLAPLGILAWTPDGRSIQFPLDLGRHYATVEVATGRTDTLMAPDSVLGFHLTAFSPDGSELVVNAVPGDGKTELWRGERSGRGWVRLDTPAVDAYPLLWSTDGWIYFLGRDGSPTSKLWRTPARGGRAEQVVILPQPCSAWETALSMDVRHLVCTVSHLEPDIWMAANFDSKVR